MSTGELPSSYGETRVVLLSVDPSLAHVYWDFSSSDLVKAKSGQAILRFSDVTVVGFYGTTRQEPFDTEIEAEAGSRYVRLPSPERSYLVDLGCKTEEGRFVRIARSNTVETPRARPSMRRESRTLLVTGNDQQVKPTTDETVTRSQRHLVRPATEGETELGKAERGAGPNEAAQVYQESGPPPEALAATQQEQGPAVPQPIDSMELIQRKLAELYHLCVWRKPPSSSQGHSPRAGAKDFDLTSLSEEMFTHGISSS